MRSATTATSSGLGLIVPQEPLQATEMTLPVLPLGCRRPRAKVNGTSRPWKTRMVLHAIFGVAVFGLGSTHGMAQSTGLQLILRPVDL